MNRYSVGLVVVVFISLCAMLPAQCFGIKAIVEQHFSDLNSSKQISQHARRITVKVLAEGLIGSGTLINREDNVYTVLTNDHVIQAGKPPYQIETFDGQIHAVVETREGSFFENNDIAVLKFESPAHYVVAQLAESSVREGEQVFGAGFPFASGSNQKESLRISKGWVEKVLNKPLERGYQVGYTNTIEKGMSGGPLLNRSGEVVSINGVHAHPLWESIYFFKDGTQVSQEQQESIGDYGWGIPIKIFKPLVLPILETTQPL